MIRNILYINTPSYIGGAEVSLLLLMKNLPFHLYKPYLLTTGEGQLANQTREVGIPVWFQEFPWLSRRWPWPYLYSIYRLILSIKRYHIDLVHTNCDHCLRYVASACTYTHTPYVSHIRDIVRPWFSPENMSALTRAKRVIANSNSTAQECRESGLESKNIAVIYNPVDTMIFEKVSAIDGEKLREELNIPSNHLVIGVVGQIQRLKGQHEFIEAGLQLAEEYSNVSFLIVGSPNDENSRLLFNSLKIRVQSTRFLNRFHFLGFRNDIPALMKLIDILVVPSHSEQFGRAAVEGMLAGCAVIASNTGGLPEIITNKVDGLLVQPKDVIELYSNIRWLILDNRFRQQIAMMGSQTAKRFSIDSHVKGIQSLYDGILDNRLVN